MNDARAVGKTLTPTDGENCAFMLLKGLVLFSVIYVLPCCNSSYISRFPLTHYVKELSLFLLPGTDLPLVESFGLFNDLFPFSLILDAGYPVLDLQLEMFCLMLSSHLYLSLPCDLLVRGFQLNIFLTVLVSGVLCT